MKGRLWKVGTRLLDGELGDAGTPRAWRWRGYAGWQAGSVAVGERPDSCYCQVTGGSAALYWLSLLALPVNVTRLDVQVTALSPRAKWDEVGHQWERIEADGNLRRLAGWRSRITTRPTGDTLYIGSPKSDRRLRLYDKHAEDPVGYPTGAWRYEVQARRSLAGSLAASLADRDGDPLTGVSTVFECFRARGVQPRFRPGGRGVLGSVPRTRTEWERTLRWLRLQVRPTVQRAMANGQRDAIERILGLG